MANSGVRVDYIALEEIARWPRNPKLHQVDKITDSIDRFGFVQPLMMDERTGQLVAGHGRLETLQKMKASGHPPPKRIISGAGGKWMVPVIRGVDFKDEVEAEAYLLADNRLTEIGGWDDKALAEIIADLQTRGSQALVGIGWDKPDIDALLQSAAAAMDATRSHFDPASPVGPSPEEYKERYDRADIKQVVLYFEGKEFEDYLSRIKSINDDHQLDGSSTAVVKFLIDFYEKSNTHTSPPNKEASAQGRRTEA
jgi:ParB-like chromosome segregation protein Spo0J